MLISIVSMVNDEDAPTGPWFSLWLAVSIHRSAADFGSNVSLGVFDRWTSIRAERRVCDRQDLNLRIPFTCCPVQRQWKRQFKHFVNVRVTMWIACSYYLDLVINRGHVHFLSRPHSVAAWYAKETTDVSHVWHLSACAPVALAVWASCSDNNYVSVVFPVTGALRIVAHTNYDGDSKIQF